MCRLYTWQSIPFHGTTAIFDNLISKSYTKIGTRVKSGLLADHNLHMKR